MGNSLINDIKAPELSQSGYGAGIKNVFEQIDANFKILGNQDFVKGDRGWSIGPNEIHILYEAKDENGVKKTYFTEDGIDVLNSIIKEITDQQYEYQDDKEHQNIETVKTWLNTIDALKSVGNVSLIDSIVPGDLFNEIYVYDPINPDNQYTIGATNDYVFKDRRFVIEMGNYGETYSSLYDCSCLVHLQVYEEEDQDTGVKTPAKKFVVIHNTPTLYFDTNVQAFCWRIGGQNTGLIAQGPKGDSGQNAAFYIVELGDPKHPIPDAPASSHTATVIKYMNTDGGWVDLADQPAPADFDDSNCIAFEPTVIGGDQTPTSYFGKIMKGTDGSFTVSCTNENRIQTNLNLNWLAATFASIRTTKALKGLFVPIKSPGPNSSYNDAPVHAIWHAPMKNYTSIFSELHISPMATYAKIEEATRDEVLGEVGGTNNSRLGVYNDYIYKSTDSDNPVSLVFDYDNVIFAGHHSDGTNGVRIGIGTNNIFGDSVGSNSLVRFSANSRVEMPGNSYLWTSKIATDYIFAYKDDIDLSCKNLNISGKDTGSVSTVSITGKLKVSGNTSLGATTINGIATVADTLKVGNTATARVNGVPDVYLGCPIGTVVMWAGTTAPYGWHICDGSGIPTNSVYSEVADEVWKDYSDLLKVLVESRYPYGHNASNYTRIDGNSSGGPHVNLPNLQQKFPLGAKDEVVRSFGPNNYNTSLGKMEGAAGHTLSTDEMPAHTHYLATDLNQPGGAGYVNGESQVTLRDNPAGNAHVVHTVDSQGGVGKQTYVRNLRFHADYGDKNIDGLTGEYYIKNTGSSQSHNNIPPYLAINFIIKYK